MCVCVSANERLEFARHLCVTVDFIELLEISYDFDIVLKTHVSKLLALCSCVCVSVCKKSHSRRIIRARQKHIFPPANRVRACVAH